MVDKYFGREGKRFGPDDAWNDPDFRDLYNNDLVEQAVLYAIIESPVPLEVLAETAPAERKRGSGFVR
jgi:hypothetical protein